MKRNIFLPLTIGAFILASGCKLFKKEEPPPEPAAVEKVEEVVKEEAPAVKEEPKEETLVSREDIEKAAKIYNMVNDEKIKEEARLNEFANLLKEFDWDLAKYHEIISDIGRDPVSARIYLGLQKEKKE